jgi:hypothetical protein
MVSTGDHGGILYVKFKTPRFDSIMRVFDWNSDIGRQASQGYQLVDSFPVALLVPGSGPLLDVRDWAASRILERYAISIEVTAYSCGRDVKSGDASDSHYASI